METSSKSTSDAPSIFNLPEGLTPNSLDTIPVLSTLLSRLQNSPPANSKSAICSTRSAASPSQITDGTGPLTDKEIPSATDGLKHQLQRARAQLKQLPDMHKSITEQEAEIKELEDKVRRQKKVILELQRLNQIPKYEERRKIKS